MSKKYPTLIVALLLHIAFTNHVRSQKKGDIAKAFLEIDSLYNVSKGGSTEEDYHNITKILKTSLKHNYINKELEAYKLMSWYYGYSSVSRNLDSALHYFNRYEIRSDQLRNSPKTKDSVTSKMIAGFYLNKATLLLNCFGLAEQGLQTLFKAHIHIPKDDILYTTNYDLLIAQAYSQKGQHRKGINILNSRLENFSKLPYTLKINVLQNLSKNYSIIEQPKKSLEINAKILKLSRKANNEYYTWWTKNENTLNYHRLGNSRKAIDSALVTRAYYKKNPNNDALFNNSLYMGSYYAKIGDIDSAIYYKKDALKMEYITIEKSQIYESLTKYYLLKNDYPEAIKMLRKKEEVSDSIRSMEKELYTNYSETVLGLLEEQKLSQEIKDGNNLLKEKNKKQQLYFCLLYTSPSPRDA